MTKWRDTFFRRETGKTYKEWARRTKAAEIVNELMQKENSKYPLRYLGAGQDSSLLLSEELRASHIHILGTTREGKSKLLELLIRHDIDNGFGCTLLDPSDNGQTAYNILRYCYKIGFTKVCLIDPHDQRVVIPTINPLRFKGTAATEATVATVMDSIRVLWSQTSFSETPRIEQYLSAVLTALYAGNFTIPDAVHFATHDDSYDKLCRYRILDSLHQNNYARKSIEEMFRSRARFINEFQSTIRRLSPFFGYLPARIFGSTASPIDFNKLLAEKWVILVNLDRTRVWGEAPQRLLGTTVVNSIISAVHDLNANGWKGQHYLYIDEAGQFATRSLAKIMAYMGKSSLWATVSHQFYNQFEDKVVLDAVENLCKLKVLFYTPNATDRNRMIRDMYTGELKEQAGDVHSHLKKQHAVIKIGKEPPATVRIADVPDVQVSPEKLQEFKESQIYKPNSWYRTAESIQDEINNRFAIRSTSAGTATKKPKPARGSNEPKGTAGEPSEQPKPGTDKASPKRKSVFDDIPDS